MINPNTGQASFTHEQIERGLRGFLLALRREHASRHPGEIVRVPMVDTLAPADRIMLLRCMEIALKVAVLPAKQENSQPTS